MNINELKQNIQDSTFNINQLNIKKYLPILHKKIIIDNVISDVISYDSNGINFVDIVQRKISMSLAVLLNYCDIEIKEDETDLVIEVLDLLYENSIFIQIEQMIGDDLQELYWMINDEIQNVKERNNSIESIVANGIQKLIDKIPNNNQLSRLIKTASKELQKFDPKKFSQIQEMIKTVK